MKERRCTRWNCNSHPILRQTGFCEPHPAWYCPVCQTPWWHYTKLLKNINGVMRWMPESFQDYPDKGTVEEWLKKHDYYWRTI